jgi:calpain-5
MMDKNRDGTISAEEFMACLDMLRLNLTASEKIALTKEVDKNKDDRINYEEILTYLEEGDENVEIKGLNHSLASFPRDSLDYAIYLLKTHIHNNKTGPNSLEAVFLRLDEDKSGGLNQSEFNVALGRLNLSLTNDHFRKLREWSPKSENNEVLYRAFFEKVCKYEFSSQRVVSKAPEEKVPSGSSGALPLQSEVIPIKQINPDKDYFQGNPNKKITTIFNNEDAALAKCFEFYSKSEKFKDPDFGPEVGQNGNICLYWNGKPSNSNFPPANEIKWKSPSDWLQNVGFFKGGISSNDVIQGSLGDCWFIGALSVLAQRDELVRGSIENLRSESQVTESNVIGIKKGVYPPIFHHFANKGLYVFRFFANSAWRWVIIDDRLPIAEQEGYEPAYVFGHCKDPAEVWVSLIEKAYAKLFGCYEALNGGLIDDALVDLTGYVAEKIKIQASSAQQADELWRILMQNKNNKCLMGCSIDSEGVESDVVVDGEPCGLLARHAYAIIDVIQIEDSTARKGRHRLVRLRNPWGQREWNGKWSDNSEEVNRNLEKLQTELKKLGSDEDYNPHDGNDGTFLMCFRDWRTLFHNLYSCLDFSDEWWGVRFFGEWTPFNSGGVPMSSNRQDAINWSKNPQYSLEIKENCQVFISLSQDDGRFTKGSVFPFEGPVKTACFTIMSLAAGEEKVNFFDQAKIVKLSVLKLHRTIEMRENLKAGRYVIVPATIKAGMTGKFSLSVYLNCDKTSAEIWNATEKVKGEIIEEEEEITLESITPKLMQDVKNQVRDITRRK